MINIVNALITRDCNLRCEYCKLSGNIDNPLKPIDYPTAKQLRDNEKDSEWWIDTLSKYYKQNPNLFTLLYGGEPMVRWKRLVNIVNYLNAKDYSYSIISNCSEGVEDGINNFFDRVGHVKGFTASIDPGFYRTVKTNRDDIKDDEVYKSHRGYWMPKTQYYEMSIQIQKPE